MQRLICLLAGLLVSASLAVPVAVADDRSLCDSPKTPPDDAIAACSRRLSSGTLRGRDIAITYNNRGWAWAQKGNYDRAIADYDEALRRDPGYDRAKNNRAAALKAKGVKPTDDRSLCDGADTPPDDAIAACSRRLSSGTLRGRDIAITYNNRGWAWSQKGNYDRAIADYDESLRREPGYDRAKNNREAALKARGAKAAPAPRPSEPATADDRSLCDSANTPPDEAIAACTRRLTSGELKGRDVAITYNNRGWGWTKKGDYDRAIADYSEALRLEPDYTLAFNNRAQAWTRKGAHDRAIADYNETIRINPKSASAYANRGRSYKAKGDLDRAIADYNEAIKLDSGNSNHYTSRCHAFNDKGDPDRAMADCNEAIRLNPKDAFAYNNRGDSYSKKGQLDEALRDFDEAIKLGMRHAIAFDNRGLIYLRKRDYDRAIVDFTEAIKIDASDPYVRRNRAEAHRLKRDYDRAIADDNEAIRLLPGFAAAFTGRGLAFEQKGERERARADFNAALGLPAERYMSGRWAHDTARQRLAALGTGSAPPAPPPATSSPPPQVAPRPPVQTATLTPPPTPPQAAPRQAEQGRRVALVIGNDVYDNLPKLQKAVNDARTLETALRKLGFEVIRVENAPRRVMNQRIFDFTAKVGRGDTAFFFFAGHGVEVKGANYLLPTDTPAAREGQEALIVDESVAADSIVTRLQDRGARVSMLVFDACRDNPFAKSGTRGVGGSRGLGLMAAPEGVFLLYSAGYGQTALDRLSDNDPHPNSVFTRTFAQHLLQGGKTMQEIAKQTQSDVRKLAQTINHQQMPAIYDQIDGMLVLGPR